MMKKSIMTTFLEKFSIISIRKVLLQEKEQFESRKVSDRIVSIDRHYVRPIVRGKETKSVEFGAKTGNIQIDEISFIKHISFKAFNEGICLKDCICNTAETDECEGKMCCR